MMNNHRENVKDFAGVIAYICQTESVLPLSRGAMASIAEQAVRLTGRNDKISLKFNMVADYVRQASYWGRSGREGYGPSEDVATAIKEKEYRLNLGEEYALNGILEEQVMIDDHRHSSGAAQRPGGLFRSGSHVRSSKQDNSHRQPGPRE